MKELVAQYIRAIKNPDWNDLSISDKAEMMKVAIANGITTLPEIRRTYNEFAKGGKMNASQGYHPSDSIKKRIANWEGSSMRTNRSFEDEAKDFNRVIPSEVRDRLTQQQKDALYSYGYNVGMGRLKVKDNSIAGIGQKTMLKRYFKNFPQIKEVLKDLSMKEFRKDPAILVKKLDEALK